ncbi:hypothetical protein [Streptomyces cyaneofuscatus]|uniref:hypothetical protein n=1 Tax=Streptomyces cyaneofuscatus TaxID=66883 RepID=UPI0034471B60
MNGPDPAQPQQFVDDVEAGPGGAMTDEVGVVTGELTVSTTLRPDGRAGIAVQYTGAEEWYVLTGSPVPLPSAGLEALHHDILGLIGRGGGAQAGP